MICSVCICCISSLVSIRRHRSILRVRLPTRQYTMPSFKVLFSALLAFTSTAWALPHSILQTRETNNAVTAAVPPRLVAYIQTFRSVDGGPLSLLPLLNEHTGVTHILLAAVHLNEQPGDITLNEHHPNDTMYDTLWSEVKQLQAGGIKVMMMLGGAARGTFERLSGDDASVSPNHQTPSSKPKQNITNKPFCSSTPTTTPSSPCSASITSKASTSTSKNPSRSQCRSASSAN